MNDLMQSWFELKWLKDHPECKIKYEELAENPPHRILGVDVHSYLESLDEFRLSPLYLEMRPVEEVMEWFNKNGNSFRHVALTAVPLIAAPVSAHWVFKHFGPWIRTFHFIPSRRKGQCIQEYDSDKGAFLKWIEKADVFLDDNPANIQAAESSGVMGIIIPRPWNKATAQRAKSIGQRAESKGQRAEGKGQRAGGKGQRAKSITEALKNLNGL
ncbi:MAG: hypothetical protein ACLQF0_01025 [Dissulfurispiraceae bacterium]